MARRIRPLLAHVGSLLDPKPPVRTLFKRAQAEATAKEPVGRDVPSEDGDRGTGVVEP
jgi:hypothetical protein